jgi:hypothetical protein
MYYLNERDESLIVDTNVRCTQYTGYIVCTTINNQHNCKM